MRIAALLQLSGLLIANSLFAADPSPVGLVPAPSEAQVGGTLEIQGPGFIVLSVQASPAEHEAAKLLATYVQRRFGQQWKIEMPQDVPADASLRVYLGRPSSSPTVQTLCREQNLSLPEHPESYALKVWSQGKSITAVVAGQTGRAVIYGQDTLFQLLTSESGKMAVKQATIRDWPTIPLRGRPHPHWQYYLKPENFDCMMSSRINFIDLRDGIYAFQPGDKLPDEIAGIIREAKNRELRVYAAVNCGVPAETQDAVIETFKQFIALGADGLWASFDDKGAGGNPAEMVKKLLALGREHRITGDAIAVTPPKGDYQTINTKFNQAIMAVPGMEQAVWYWTSIPCAEDVASGKSIGMQVKPSWWHNWPRLQNSSFRSGSERAYTTALNMADGWNHPNDRELRAMGDYVHAVMPWDGWQAQQHYLVPIIGWWSWRPEQYDLQAVRAREYDMVFGPQQVKTIAAIDQGLDSIRTRFQFWQTETDYAPRSLPRLKKIDDRARTEADLEALQTSLEPIRKAAVSQTLLPKETLEKEYLEPLAREFEAGLAAARAPYPEYWYPAHQNAVLNAIYDGKTAEADRLIAGVRERISKELAEIEKMLPHERSIKSYVAWWQKRADMNAVDWQKLIEKRQADLQERIPDYSRTVAPISQLLSGVNDPPVQVGTGLWEGHNHALATVLPEPRETFWGDWIGGVCEHEGTKAIAFALEKHLPTNAGVYSELPVNIPISGMRDRLGLLVYVADANKESFGLGRAKWRWAGHRSIKLLWGERELWTADAGIPRLTGEWFVVPLPELPADLKTLPLRLRIEDYYTGKNCLEIVYVGPLTLVEFDRD